MKGFIILAVTAALLSACGHTTGDRVATGAGIGAGVGVIAGPPGIIVGGLAGAAVGGKIDSKDVNLGTPVWDQKPWWEH
jgi:hypothetical protein